MKWRRWFVAVAALSVGGFMLFDGARALWVGDYVTPSQGPRAGQLGPWAAVVSALGVSPRGTPMKVTFVVLGLLWIAGLLASVRRPGLSRRVLGGLSVATLWYLPLGTALSAMILALVAADRRHAR